MQLVAAETVDRLLDFPGLVEALREAFVAGVVQPVRHHHVAERPDGQPTTLLLMPAWTDFMAAGTSGGGHIGVKIVTVTPDNNSIGLPAVAGVYLLMDGRTGAPQALIDGARLTLWRTAAASALAASFLARDDAATHLVVGAGALSAFLARAHRAVRPITRTLVWNRTGANAEQVAATLRAEGMAAEAVSDLEAAARRADVISTCTISSTPLVRGAWLGPGTHVDLVGAFAPSMRESDDEVMRRGRVHVDTMAGATKEAGDIVQALASGALTAERIEGDLFGLCRAGIGRRRDASDITVFKSVGAAIEDLAGGILVYRRLSA